MDKFSTNEKFYSFPYSCGSRQAFMIFIAGISIALFISALLLVKKDKSKSDIILLGWMVLNAFHLLLFYLLYVEVIYDYSFLLGLQFPLPLLHGVMLYYYVASVTNQFPKKKIISLIHLIPTIATLIYLLPFFMLPPEQKIEIFKTGGKDYLVFQEVLVKGIFLSGVVYVIWSNLLLQNHKKRIRNQFSNIEDVNLKWLKFLTYGLGILWSLIIISQNDTLIFIGISIFVILIGFFGIQQKSIFLTKEIEYKIIEKEIGTAANEVKVKEKYVSSGLSEQKAATYYDKLNGLIQQEKFYLNADLSLNDLASKLDIHPNYLSEIINKKENKTFYDYINTHRVNEFKKQIAIPKNHQFTLMAIAYDCGFNSKSSFNRHFKKITGKTPSQYAKALKN